MKKSIALLCFALATGVASSAQAADDSTAFCTQLSSDIAAQSALFATVASATSPAYNKDVVLRDIANEIWSLRTRMAYFDCAQARTFAY